MTADRPSEARTPLGRPGLLHEELTRRVLRVYFDVYNELRSGFLESVYAGAFEVACRDTGLDVEREADVPVWFRGRQVAAFRADFLVESVLLVELKAVQRLDEVHVAQVLNYLRATAIEVGLLLNFGPRPSFQRLVLQNHRKGIRVPPRISAVPPAVPDRGKA